MIKILVTVAMAVAAAVLPARASAAGAPEKLSDAQLDRVKGGFWMPYPIFPVPVFPGPVLPRPGPRPIPMPFPIVPVPPITSMTTVGSAMPAASAG